jgi:aminoglycoside phosphotransferase (APT) family kinase protein
MGEEEPDRQSGDAGNCEFLPLRDTSRFDRRALGRYLGAIGIAYDPEQSIQQFAGGFANRNYLLEIDGRRAVLRRPPSGELPKGAHDMAREHRILRALSPVFELAPASLHYCSDPSVIGAPFQLLEYREGLILRGWSCRANFPPLPTRSSAQA